MTRGRSDPQLIPIAAKVERGERRLDVIEFLEVARALQLDVRAFLHQLDAP